jgi:hypothetical protein
MQNYKFVSNYGYLSVNYYSRPKLQCMKQIGEDRNPSDLVENIVQITKLMTIKLL